MLGKINAAKVRSYIGRWIASSEAEEIITLKLESTGE